MGCCGHANWKREEVPDHKFDFIDVRDYFSNSLLTRLRYVWVFILVIKGFAVYIADIYTAVTLLAFHKFNGNIYQRVEQSPNNTLRVPFVYGRWIFTGCIIFSFCLLAYEAHRARAVVRSRDISYAYTNIMANNYYSMRSYDHFCFFCQLNNSKKKKDELAFFIFFTFKGWKSLLVADGPRQVINALTLYALAESVDFSSDIYKYYEGNYFTAMMLLTMVFTVVIFAGSAFLLGLACLLYVPMIFYIRGNLKEYCCHKIDKRISELVQKKKKQRLGKYAAIARAEAAGDFSHLMNKQGIIVGRKMVQPTLPDLDIDELERKGTKKHRGIPVQRTASMSSSTVNGMQGDNGGFYGMKEGEEYASTAHLMTNQGYAGSVYGHPMPGNNLSLSSGTLNASLPPSTHNSPDSYPLRVRGLNGVQDLQRGNTGGQNMATVLAQMGPIGTSPGLFAQRKVGLKNGYDEQQGYSSSGLANEYAINDARSRSALGQDDAAYYGDAVSTGGAEAGAPLEAYEMHGQQQDQIDYSNVAEHHIASQSGAHYPHDHSHYPDAPGGGAAPPDMSLYAPYEGQGDDYAQQNRGGRVPSFAFGDVYDAYLEEPAHTFDHDANVRSPGASSQMHPFAFDSTPDLSNRGDMFGHLNASADGAYGHRGQSGSDFGGYHDQQHQQNGGNVGYEDASGRLHTNGYDQRARYNENSLSANGYPR